MTSMSTVAKMGRLTLTLASHCMASSLLDPEAVADVVTELDGDAVAGADTAEHGNVFALLIAELHDALLETTRDDHEDMVLPQRRRRHHRQRLLFKHHARDRKHARPQRVIGVGDLRLHDEVAAGTTHGRADVANRAPKRATGHGSHLELNGLAFSQRARV